MNTLTTKIIEFIKSSANNITLENGNSQTSSFEIESNGGTTGFDSSSIDSKMNSFEEKVIISVFVTVIILGFFGNILVIWTVIFNKHMRTSNNLFILNLAVSDITLCVFSIPFNVYKVLRHSWVFGEFLCKLAPFFQATNVFVSTMSITAIALDRYVNIVCAMKIRQSNNFLSSYGSITCLIFIWAFAFLLSSPLFIFNKYFKEKNSYIFQENLNSSSNEFASNSSISNNSSFASHEHETLEQFEFDETLSEVTVAYCIEDWPFPKSRLIYSYASLLIQYTLPIIIVGIAYGSIWWKLKSHRNKLKSHNQQSNTSKATRAELTVLNLDPKSHTPTPLTSVQPTNNNNNNGNEHIERKNVVKSLEKMRRLKMNLLLIFIAVIFAASWLPLNIFNILSDSKLSIIKANKSYYLINAVCILFGMSSAVSNPFLYGFLNENFKREYVTLFMNLYSKIKTCRSCSKSAPNAVGTGVIVANGGKRAKNVNSFEMKKKKGAAIDPKNCKNDEEQKRMLRSGPVILVNNESMNDNLL